MIKLESTWSESFPAMNDICWLITTLKENEYEYLFFKDRASMTNEVRLTSNLKTLLSLGVLGKEISIHKLLTMEEKRMLRSIQTLNLTPKLISVAYGLLNVHERVVLAKSMSKHFKKAIAADS